MNLKQCFVTGLCATLIVGLPVTQSSAVESKRGRPSRTVRAPYYGPAVAVSTPAGFVTAHCHPEYSLGCVKIPTRAKDRFVKLEIEDLSGQDVFAMVLDQADSELAFICGKTNSKLSVAPNSFIEVWLLEGTCSGTTKPSSVTSGEVVATFSRTR